MKKLRDTLLLASCLVLLAGMFIGGTWMVARGIAIAIHSFDPSED